MAARISYVRSESAVGNPQPARIEMVSFQQPAQPVTCLRENRRPMRKKNSLCFVIQKFLQGAAHLFLIRAILRGQKREPIWFKINQCVANNQRSSIAGKMKHDLTGCRALNVNRAQSATDFLAISNGC